jgi:Zn-finger nucleic acid-binding protein
MANDALKLECLRCGETRDPLPGLLRRFEAGECPRCRYVGWAATVELSELVRRSLRERPPERRRLHAI